MEGMVVQVVDSRRLADPPLMRLESEGGHAYLSMLLQLSASQTQAEQQAEVEARLVTLALATLQRFQVHTLLDYSYWCVCRVGIVCMHSACLCRL